MTASIGPHDVLCGRGGATNNHEGNRRFRSIVVEHQTEYLTARKMEKAVIARQIVEAVHNNGGRYLKRSKTADTWVEVPLKQATAKTSQALREGLDVRNKTVRSTKALHRDSDAGVPTDQHYHQHHNSRVVTGRVSSGSPALVSLSGEQVPDMRGEYLSPMNPVFMRYQPPPISRSIMEHAFEV
jgi:uncharacterized protein (DUF1330 family)